MNQAFAKPVTGLAKAFSCSPAQHQECDQNERGKDKSARRGKVQPVCRPWIKLDTGCEKAGEKNVGRCMTSGGAQPGAGAVPQLGQQFAVDHTRHDEGDKHERRRSLEVGKESDAKHDWNEMPGRPDQAENKHTPASPERGDRKGEPAPGPPQFFEHAGED
ncbi:MAG: hypothetical protein RIR33_2378 [Pseudomonadota bacterium]